MTFVLEVVVPGFYSWDYFFFTSFRSFQISMFRFTVRFQVYVWGLGLGVRFTGLGLGVSFRFEV